MSGPRRIPNTPLEQRYGALHVLRSEARAKAPAGTEPLAGQKAQLAVAEELIGSGVLATEYVESVRLLEEYANDEDFHDGRSPRDDNDGSQTIDRTIHLAHRLERARSWRCGDRRLSYIDRELRPLRTTGGARRGGPGVGRPAAATPLLDLLLADDEGVPAIAEIKIGADENQFYALIQALMHAAALSTPAQRKRLASHAQRQGDHQLRTEGPLDVLLLLHRPKQSGVRPQLAAPAQALAEELAGDTRMRPFIRRIDAVDVDDSGVGWTSLWAAMSA